jgi:hypothetical protein
MSQKCISGIKNFMTSISEASVDPDQQLLLDSFERAIAAGQEETARQALREYLFAAQGLPCEGSLADAIEPMTQHPADYVAPAAVVLRALSVSGVVRVNASNNMARYVVQLVEGALPELPSLANIAPKMQNFQKLEALEHVHRLVLDRLEPLRTPYSSVDSLLAGKAAIMGSLRYPLVRQYCRPYHVNEVAEAVDALIGKVARVHRIEGTLADDVEACQQEITSVRSMAAQRPSFLTSDHLVPFLDHADEALAALLSDVRARFQSTLQRSNSTPELQKRYPLHEPERELRVIVAMRNLGPGNATGVTFRITSTSNHVLIENADVSLGTIPPGEFSIAMKVIVVEPSDSFSADVHITWGELGSAKPSEDLFEVRVLAQRADIDWARYKYINPYAEAPASGGRFIGRREQVHTLVSRILQTPMEPTYIDGQKRVGKTSLSQTAVDEAVRHDPNRKLHKLYILWGNLAAEDSRATLRRLGREIEEFIVGGLPDGGNYERGDYEGTLAPLLKLSQHAASIDQERRFVVIIDEFDDIAQDLYLQGNLAETFFANIRAITATPNICLLLVGSENMPYIMDRQGQKLNRFSRVNLDYFSRATEWEDFQQLVRQPSDGVLEWHLDAVSEVFNFSSGNPYFAKIVCKDVMAHAVRERDADITAEEVKQVVHATIARLESNQFAHMWQDGIYSPIEGRETVALKRRRTLAALARCLRAGEPATLANIYAQRGAAQCSEGELVSLLGNFIARDVLLETGGVYDFKLPIFRLWLMGVGLSRLANDRLSEELASMDQQLEEDARVEADEIVNLTKGWPPYRGTLVGPEVVRAWLSQRETNRDQRLLFTLLKSVRVVSMEENIQRLKSAGNVIRDTLGVPTRKKLSDRRDDVVITYVDGEGKSGQRYASDFAEENTISRHTILPPSSFEGAFRKFTNRKGEPPKAIVIIDDVVATGKSLAKNVTEFVEKHGDLLAESRPKILVYSLFATEQGMDRVRIAISTLAYNDIDYRAGEMLTEDAFAFTGETGVFGTVGDRDRAKALAEDIGARIYPSNPLGYGGQGLLLVLPTTVPNNTLPILHSRSKDPGLEWEPLFERMVN